ncbi:hypothetical protein [Streptomyces capoamus]|uniref:hypothetical protein n=1 Tax=Streptomyces capoamus TaxID=68183 RepID=UPI0016748CFB|nr:hypothetical protein [Streptomyces capoamus]
MLAHLGDGQVLVVALRLTVGPVGAPLAGRTPALVRLCFSCRKRALTRAQEGALPQVDGAVGLAQRSVRGASAHSPHSPHRLITGVGPAPMRLREEELL